MRRTIHPGRRLGPINPTEETTSTSRSDTRSETTSTSREERRPSRGSLIWSRPIPSPWHVFKDELMKLDLQRVSFIEDARRMLNGARLSVSRLYSITGVDWLIETAGRLVTSKNTRGSGVTAPYGTIDDAGRVQLSQTVIRQGISNVTRLMGSSRTSERRVRKMPAKKVSRIIDVQKKNRLKYNFTGVPETDPRACFNRATWSPAVNLQQPPLGTSHLILVDSLVRVLSNLRTSWVTTVMAFISRRHQ